MKNQNDNLLNYTPTLLFSISLYPILSNLTFSAKNARFNKIAIYILLDHTSLAK